MSAQSSLAARTRNPGALGALLTAGFIAWFALVAVQTYGNAPAAWEYATTQWGYAVRTFGAVPRNLESLLLAISFVFSALFPGYLLTGLARVTWSSRAERLIFALAFGLIFYTFAFLVLGVVGLLQPELLFALTAACSAGSTAVLLRESKRDVAAEALPKTRPLDIALGVALAFFLFVSLLGGLNYELRFDAAWYHLAEARRWALDERISDLLAPNRSYTAGLPHYQEVLYAGLISMFGVIAAKLLAWLDLPLALTAMFVFVSRYMPSRTFGLLAALIFVSLPIVGLYSAGTGSNDLPLASLTLLAVYAVLRWNETPRAYGWLALAGALCGYSTGVKTTGLFTLAACGAAIVALTLRRRRRLETGGSRGAAPVTSVLAFAGCALAFAAPSLIQATVWTRDPFYPLFGSLFKTPYDLPYLIPTAWSADYLHHVLDHVLYFLGLPWWLTFENNTVVGPVFLVMTPVVVLALLLSPTRRPVMLFLAAFCALWAALFNLAPTIWFRYAEAIAPLLSLLAAYPLFVAAPGIAGWQALRVAVAAALALMIAMNNPFTVPFQRKALVPGHEGAANLDWNYLYLNAPPPIGAPAPPARAAMIAYLNANLPAGARVYDGVKLYPWTLYVNPVLYTYPHKPSSWRLWSREALDQLQRNHLDYIVFFVRDVPRIRTSRLWSHLQPVWSSPDDVPGSGDGTAVTLYRVR